MLGRLNSIAQIKPTIVDRHQVSTVLLPRNRVKSLGSSTIVIPDPRTAYRTRLRRTGPAYVMPDPLTSCRTRLRHAGPAYVMPDLIRYPFCFLTIIRSRKVKVAPGSSPGRRNFLYKVAPGSSPGRRNFLYKVGPGSSPGRREASGETRGVRSDGVFYSCPSGKIRNRIALNLSHRLACGSLVSITFSPSITVVHLSLPFSFSVTR